MDIFASSKLERYDGIWMGLCYVLSSASKDRSTQVGAVIVNQFDQVVSTGWNGFPKHVNDDDVTLNARPEKYVWTVHAELNAIANAASTGVSTRGCKLYTSMPTCSRCAPVIAQARIVEVIQYGLHNPGAWKEVNPETKAKWFAEAKKAGEIFAAARVVVRNV